MHCILCKGPRGLAESNNGTSRALMSLIIADKSSAFLVPCFSFPAVHGYEANPVGQAISQSQTHRCFRLPHRCICTNCKCASAQIVMMCCTYHSLHSKEQFLCFSGGLAAGHIQQRLSCLSRGRFQFRLSSGTSLGAGSERSQPCHGVPPCALGRWNRRQAQPPCASLIGFRVCLPCTIAQ